MKVKGLFVCVLLLIASFCAIEPVSAKVAFTISGRVISGPPGNSRAVQGSTVTVFQAAVQGFPVSEVFSVKTNQNGKFTMRFTNSPHPGALLYLVAGGGKAGKKKNPAIGMMAIVGTAPFPETSLSVTVNEQSTIAAAYVTANFISSETTISDNLSFPTLTTAVQSISNLVDVQSGGLGSVLGNANNNASRFQTLANALANCVRTTATSAACTNLFGVTNSPVDTLGAIINISKSPTNNVAALFSLGSSGPYAPALGEAPTDWILPLTYTGGGLSTPNGIAVDHVGDVWITNPGNSSVTELSAFGAALSPPTGFTGGGLNLPSALAITSTGNGTIDIWIANAGNDSVTELNSSGSSTVPGSPSGGFTGGGLSAPQGITIDGAGRIWVANHGNDSVAELNSSGLALSPPSGFTGGGVNAPSAIVADGSGNIWVANGGNSALSDLNSNGEFLSPSTGFTGGGLDLPNSIAAGGACKVWVTNGASNVSVTDSAGVPVSPGTGFVAGGLNSPAGIALDGGRHFWIANQGSNSVTEIDSAGMALSPLTGFKVPGLSDPKGVAIDGSGNVWVTNSSGDSVTELIGAAVHVVTPLTAPAQSSCQLPPTTPTTPTAGTTMTLSSSSNHSTVGEPVVFTATVTPINPSVSGTPTGTVSFFDGNALLGAITLNGGGPATLNIPTLNAGSHSITAAYGGDANFAASTSAPLVQVVAPPTTGKATTTTLISSPNPSTVGQPIIFTATVSPANPSVSGTPTGTLSFSDNGTPIGNPVPLSGGQATLSVSILEITASPHSITAAYSGDTNFAESISAPLPQVVNPPPTTTTCTSSPNPSTVGDPVSFTATVSPSVSGTPTGTVTFFDGSIPLGTPIEVSGDGLATLSISTLSAGPHSITADYGGDANFGASTCAPLTQVVKFPTTTTLTSSVCPDESPFCIIATVSPVSPSGSITPTGTVSFFDNGTPIGNPVQLSGGQAIQNISDLGSGPHSITADYGGDASFAPSSDTLTLCDESSGVGSCTTTALTLNNSNSQLCAPPNPNFCNITATVNASPSGAIPPTGTVSFSDNGSQIGDQVQLNGGQAMFDVSDLGIGTHIIKADYSGNDASFAASSGTLTVCRPSSDFGVQLGLCTTTTLISSPNPSTVGQSVVFTATVTPVNPSVSGTPTGTVSFFSNGGLLGSGPITLVGGQAQLSVDTLDLGNDSITAAYAGDANFAASTTQEAFTQMVGQPIVPTPVPIVPAPVPVQ
jgi:sugar lactone lactonase YvrE